MKQKQQWARDSANKLIGTKVEQDEFDYGWHPSYERGFADGFDQCVTLLEDSAKLSDKMAAKHLRGLAETQVTYEGSAH